MIRDRGDWVISRQCAWGVPLQSSTLRDGTAIMAKEVTDHVAGYLLNIFNRLVAT